MSVLPLLSEYVLHPFPEGDKRVFSLHLPILLHPDNFYYKTELLKQMDDLLGHCAVQGVEVVWHDEPMDEVWRISKAFQKYARRVKAEREMTGDT
jgi:hypothetical protein